MALFLAPEVCALIASFGLCFLVCSMTSVRAPATCTTSMKMPPRDWSSRSFVREGNQRDSAHVHSSRAERGGRRPWFAAMNRYRRERVLPTAALSLVLLLCISSSNALVVKTRLQHSTRRYKHQIYTVCSLTIDRHTVYTARHMYGLGA